jgi:hypothetical protein
MAGNHGGARPGAGRKTDRERAQTRAKEAVKLSRVEEIGAEYEEQVWKEICEKAAQGNRDAQKLFADHQWGRPGQRKGGSTDPVVNLWCSFRGVPWVCLECQKEKRPDDERAGEDRAERPVVHDGGAGST